MTWHTNATQQKNRQWAHKRNEKKIWQNQMRVFYLAAAQCVFLLFPMHVYFLSSISLSSFFYIIACIRALDVLCVSLAASLFPIHSPRQQKKDRLEHREMSAFMRLKWSAAPWVVLNNQKTETFAHTQIYCNFLQSIFSLLNLLFASPFKMCFTFSLSWYRENLADGKSNTFLLYSKEISAFFLVCLFWLMF